MRLHICWGNYEGPHTHDLPLLKIIDIAAVAKAAKAHEALEELRLGYVAWTRARHLLSVSAWSWAPHLKGGLGPSDYLRRTVEVMAGWGRTGRGRTDSCSRSRTWSS